MLNKNVADYTDFQQGKTNKKIVQAPGGTCSFSLAWSDEKTDYGPQRAFKRKDNYSNQEAPSSRPPSHPSNYNYNEPMRVMEEPKHYEAPMGNYRQEAYSPASQQLRGPTQSNNKIGGEYGYANYVPEVSPYQGNQPQKYGHDSLDLKVQEHQPIRTPPMSSMQPPTSSSNSSYSKPSIKIIEQKGNLLIGDNSYNYWKDNGEERKKTNHSSRPPLNEHPIQHFDHRQEVPERTSVKVHNPPGGKSSFTFG